VSGHGAPKPALRVVDAVLITAGIVVGAGIFKTPASVAELAGSPEWMLLAWIAGGVLSLIGALCYAELASTFPSAGGDYHFLRRAYGRDVSFLFAWARVTVITSGSIALLAFVFGEYATRVVPLGPASEPIYAAGVVLLLTAVNLAGLRASSRVQNVLTVVELGGLVLVIAVGLWLGIAMGDVASTGGATGTAVSDAGAAAAAAAGAGAAGTAAGAATSASAGGVPAMFGLVMVFVLLTYGGWNEAAYVSAEVRGGPRAIVRALLYALLLVTVIYVLAVYAMYSALGLAGLAGSDAPAADVLQRAFGPAGGQVIGLVVAVAALTSMNATMIVGARTNFALGVDWPRLRRLGAWDEVKNLPRVGFLVQGFISLALVAVGSFERDGFAAMVEFTAPVFWSFFLLTGISVFVLRWREPDVPRPFRVPLYPLTPLVFCATCAYLLWSSVTYAQSQNATAVALWVMAAGVVAWVVLRLVSRKV
jgi:basic amino acid/polyamine antiporter, APA family